VRTLCLAFGFIRVYGFGLRRTKEMNALAMLAFAAEERAKSLIPDASVSPSAPFDPLRLLPATATEKAINQVEGESISCGVAGCGLNP